MSEQPYIKTYLIIFNVLETLGVLCLLFMAFAFQYVLHELPCPLCLLQRVGFLGICFALLLNLRFGPRPSHYGLSLLAALFTAFVSLRQVSLHAVPGTEEFGPAVFGLHMYTWSFVVAMLVIIFTTIALSIDRQYLAGKAESHATRKRWTHILFAVVLFLLVSNVVTTFMICGVKQCPDNPTQYLYQKA